MRDHLNMFPHKCASWHAIVRSKTLRVNFGLINFVFFFSLFYLHSSRLGFVPIDFFEGTYIFKLSWFALISLEWNKSPLRRRWLAEGAHSYKIWKRVAAPMCLFSCTLSPLRLGSEKTQTYHVSRS